MAAHRTGSLHGNQSVRAAAPLSMMKVNTGRDVWLVTCKVGGSARTPTWPWARLTGVEQATRKRVTLRGARVIGPSLRSRHRGAPNGSRLSCGRNTGGRKEVERLMELNGEATQFFLTGERPA